MIKTPPFINILGIDPGLETVGWGQISSNGVVNKYIDSGKLETTAKDDQPLRLQKLYQQMQELIAQTKPQVVSMEKLFFFRNVTSAIYVSQAQGVLLLACEQANLPIYHYTPLQIKLIMTGYGRADKKEVKKEEKKVSYGIIPMFAVPVILNFVW